ncbi:MAG: DNA adenine methylase [Capnocytophaga sp.]|nr:DNA adenine methylase [Capnocytophaga sp.]
MKNNKNHIKPFIKWAGGKTQLIPYIKNIFPDNFSSEKYTYIEPFVGSGALLFYILKNYDNIQKVVINDINIHLINVYKTIQNKPYELLYFLNLFQQEFHSIENLEIKKEYYTKQRNLYNTFNNDIILQSALFIFLNKTCFNGLYRVNKKGEFNVPIGSYKKPIIYERENILAVSNVLQNTEILCGDFENTLSFANGNTMFYLDPPYKPLSQTANFTSYAKEGFDDKEQIRLRNFCIKLNELHYYWILSNSDIKNIDENNLFFDDLYANFIIQRVEAKRSINSNAEKRGKITELLINNYKTI